MAKKRVTLKRKAKPKSADIRKAYESFAKLPLSLVFDPEERMRRLGEQHVYACIAVECEDGTWYGVSEDLMPEEWSTSALVLVERLEMLDASFKLAGNRMTVEPGQRMFVKADRRGTGSMLIRNVARVYFDYVIVHEGEHVL